MSQYKKHPIDIALEALSPIIAPSFALRSARDGEKIPDTYPLVDYIIIGGQGKVYDKGTNQWRSSFLIQLDILIQETKPLSWCEFDELKDAQDRHSLFWLFEQMLENFISLTVNPTAVSNLLRENDMIYSEYRFKMESYIQTLYRAQQGMDKLTGVSGRFVMSMLSEDGSGCCLINGGLKQLERLQDLTIEGSVSYKNIQNQITP